MISRHHIHALTVAVTVASMGAWSSGAQAQGDYDGPGGQGVVLYAHGGAFSPLTHLDEAKTVDFNTGYNVGGSVAYHLNRHVALRGNFTFARAKARAEGLARVDSIGGTMFNRFIYDVDLQLRHSLRGDVAPYLFVGAGGITVQRDTVRTQSSFTKGAGKAGLGLSYQIPTSEVSVYVEATGWIYKWDHYGFNKTQFDATWSGGIVLPLRTLIAAIQPSP
jgi:hypothetical protein